MIESVKLIECPRDAWQGLQHVIPTQRKVEYLRGLISAGFRHIDAVLRRIKGCADKAGLAMVAYISMAFGNPYGDPWNEKRLVESTKTIAGIGITSISIADTIGAATPELIHHVVSAVLHDCSQY